MEDIIEKLRLLDYEKNFCFKFKKDTFSKFYFACSTNSYKPVTPNTNSLNNQNTNNNINVNQFISFYELSYWLMLIIKNVRLNINISF
jgi:hypothetical protein